MPRKTKFETALREAFGRHVAEPEILLALALIRGETTPLEASQAARNLERQCCNPPGHHYLLMTALDDLLETCGVEHIGEVDMHDGPPVEYLNTGDPYANTLCWFRDRTRRQFEICSWGDLVESGEYD